MKRKIYEPVREFERATSYCPLYLAWRIVDEARDYFRTPIPEAFADQLARRAEAVFAKSALSSAKWRRGNGRGGASSKPLSPALSPFGGARVKRTFWQRKYQSARGREYILSSMRHWLAGVLARERPALFRALPESFKVGHPLPEKHCSSGRQSAPSSRRQSQSRFTSAAPVSKMGRRNLRPRFVHGCELIPV
jgi:hypothetical protein